MKKTLLVLSLTAAASSVYAGGATPTAGKDPLESAITKNNPGALKALASVYRANNITLAGDTKARLIALAKEQVEKKKKGCGSPTWKALKDPNNLFILAAQSIMCVAGARMLWEQYNNDNENKWKRWSNYGLGIGQEILGLAAIYKIFFPSDNGSAALKNAQKTLELAEQLPAAV